LSGHRRAKSDCRVGAGVVIIIIVIASTSAVVYTKATVVTIVVTIRRTAVVLFIVTVAGNLAGWIEVLNRVSKHIRIPVPT
jgi:hypothetical protein